MNESRVKNDLLEQALRVIAQENLDLELKKIKEARGGTSSRSARNSRNVSPLPLGNKIPTEEEETIEDIETGSIINSDMDEFFDIGN